MAANKPGSRAEANQNIAARGVNIVLGVWLFISAFVWVHTGAQMTNTWIVGILVALFGAIAVRFPQARWVNTALAIWLGISLWVLPTFAATFWNNLIVGLAVLVASLIPGEATGTTAGRRAPPERRPEERREPERPAA